MMVGLRLNSYESKLWLSLKLNLFYIGQHDLPFMKPFTHSFIYLVKKYLLNIYDILHTILSPWENKKGTKILVLVVERVCWYNGQEKVNKKKKKNTPR